MICGLSKALRDGPPRRSLQTQTSELPMLHLALTTACLALSSGLAPAPRLSLAPRSAALRSSPIVLVKEDCEVEEECPSPEEQWPVPLQAYSEESRKYRRTVYFHDSWVNHRSTDRFFKNFKSTLDSGVVRSLYTEILSVTGIAVAVVVINMLISGYDDFSSVHHAGPLHIPFIKDLALPALPFTIAMPALSLLLVFRTNTAYFRWNEARTLWGGIVNTCRNLQRQSNVYFREDADGQMLRDQLARQAALFPKALKSFLRGADDDKVFKKEATILVGPDTANALMASKNRATFVCNLISATVKRANMDPMDRANMDSNTNKLVDYLGACERIFRSPIPLVYTRHTARFLTSFMLLLPLALWEPMRDSWNHWTTIPATAILGASIDDH